MAFAVQSIKAASAILDQSDYDVAAGLSEGTITDFLDAHWKSESQSASSVYRGTGRAEELGITWTYDVRSPATIDLLPISPAAFAKIYRGWLGTVPEIQRHLAVAHTRTPDKHEKGFLGDTPPPNVQIRVSNLSVTIKTDTGISVDFNYAVVITGFIETDVVGGARVVRVTPIAAKVTDPNGLKARIAAAVPKVGAAMNTDCVALEKLFLYILNVLIANRLGSFIREFSLPVPIDIVNGVTISDVELQIVDDLLVLMGRLGKQVPAAAPMAALLDMPDDQPRRDYAKQASLTADALTLPRGSVLPVMSLDAKSLAWPSRGLFVILHERLFQAFANTVGVDTRAEHCKSFFAVKGCYGYAARVWGATAKVIDSGLAVAAQFSGGGWAKGCIVTHCHEECHKVGISADADPKFETEFAILGRELWMAARPRMFNIDWHVDGLPWPISKIIEWVLDGLSSLTLVILQILRVQWRKQLTTFPDAFPGTGLAYNPKLDTRILKDPSQPALVIVGEVDFLP